MKTRCLFSVVTYLSFETLASGTGLPSKVNKGEAATTKSQRGQQSLRAVNEKATAAAPAEAAAVDQVLASECSARDSFTLTDYPDSSSDGCFRFFQEGLDDVEYPVFSTLRVAGGDGLYFWPSNGAENDLRSANQSEEYIWAVGTITFDRRDEMTMERACVDADGTDAFLTHPAEVTSWSCLSTTTTSTYTSTHDEPLNATCGCYNAVGTLFSSYLVGGGALATGGAFLALLGANLLLVARSASML